MQRLEPFTAGQHSHQKNTPSFAIHTDVIWGVILLWSESRVPQHGCPLPATPLKPGSALLTDWLVLPGCDTAIIGGKAAGRGRTGC